MVRRTIRVQQKRSSKSIQKGGAGLVGEDVNSISSFTPNSIPGLALWIKVNKDSVKYSKISDYIPTQSISVQQQLRTVFKNNLDASVITEITGVNNSLIRFELDSADSKSFPTLLSDPSGTDMISLNYDTKDGSTPSPFKLVTKNPIELPEKYSMWSTSENISFDYIPSFSQFVISPNLASYMITHVSKFLEIIVYSRQLNPREIQQVEGYLAYINNTQYKLPLYHPYLPDMSYLPYLIEPISNITDIDNSINEARKKLDDVPTDLCGNTIALKGRLTDALDDTSEIRQIFYKGALLSKKEGSTSLESIYSAADRLHILTIPFNAEFVKRKLADITQMLLDIYNHIELNTPNLEVEFAEREAMMQKLALEDAQTEEIFEETQREIQAREFYETLRQRSAAIKINGDMMHGPIYRDFEDRMSVFWDAIEYSNKMIGDSWNSITMSFKKIENQINSRAWLKYVPTLDISESEIVKRGNFITSIQYKDPYLNIVQTEYQKIRNQIYDGDMAYIQYIVPILYKECAAIMKDIENKIIQPITIKTFLPHFKQRYYEINRYLEYFNSIAEPITECIQILTTALENSKKSGTASILNNIPVIPVQDKFRSDCNTIYMRRVNASDSSITGIEYIVTDVEGNIHSTVNYNGDIDNNYIFPKYMNLTASEEDLMFFLYHPYKDLHGNNLRQEFKIQEELPALSIIDSLSAGRRPNYWFHKGDNLYEIARDEINGIHQFVVEYSQYPIQLPKYAIPVGSYFLIQNVGPLPIQVQIPGFPDDLIDMIGFGESMLYIYSGLQETYGKSYYGRVPWREDYIPYDTLLNSPRSSYSVFVKELNTSIYVKKNLQPLLDYDGYFIKANVDSKGFTYDIDDVYQANPYHVRSLKQVHLSDLKHRGSKMTYKATESQIWILKDIVTSLPVLCNYKGVPGINEYGFCKFVKTPIMIIDNHTVIRGAFADINVKIAGTLEIEQMGVLEPFLNFNSVYRSKFVQAYEKDKKKTYVFIGLSKYPILSPKNNMIEAESWQFMPPQEITYVNTKDTLSIAYLVDISGNNMKSSSFNIAPYPYIAVQETRLQIEMKKSAKIVLNRYITNKNYIIDRLNIIKKVYERIQKLGAGASEGTLSILNTANEQIQADLEKYIVEEQRIQPIQASLNSQMLTNTLKIAIDMLDLEMKKIIESVSTTFKSIGDSIDFTMNLVNDIENIERTVTDFRVKNIVEIEQLIISVKSTFQTDAQNLKITGAPEFDRLLRLMIKYKIEFIQRLGALETAINASRPSYSTEYTAWIKDKREKIRELNDYLLKIREIEHTDIPRVFEIRETLKRTEYIKKFRELAEQNDSYKKYKEAIISWLGMPETSAYIQQKPIINTGRPSIQGLSINLIVFNELKNPSVQRDWQQIDTTPEISAKISAELITPITALKDKYRFTLVETEVHNDSSTTDSLKQMDLNSIRNILDSLKIRAEETTTQLVAFESEMAPILKAYEHIRSDLRAEARKTLLANNQKIQEQWLQLTEKRTALQTLLVQSADPEKEKMVGKISDIESNVVDNIRTNPVYFDGLSYFEMRREQEEQEKVLKELNI
jgi:hypothetical protein